MFLLALHPYDPLTTGLYTAKVFGVTDRAGLGMEAPYVLYVRRTSYYCFGGQRVAIIILDLAKGE